MCRRCAICRILLVGFSIVLSMSLAAAADSVPTGTITGRVIDAGTQAPIVGATVMVVGHTLGAATDEDGRYKMASVPVGHYSLTMRSLGFEPVSRTDVIVKPGRTVFVDAELIQSAVEVAPITVSAGYFAQPEDQPTSSVSFSAEEVRRSPGTAGDVSRIVSGLPSVAKVDDQFNSLAVRGGSPLENAFYLDNIEIPNINHYPVQGTTGGPIGLLNVDFLSNVDFSAGGFPAAYGNRLSSVMELSFREGNREEFEGQVGVHFAGIDAIGEGPIAEGRGSWMLSARRSFLDLLVDAIGTGVAPRYSDYQGKLVYDLSSRSKISLLGVVGVDYINFDKAQAVEDGNSFYGVSDGWESAYGINWRYRWGNGYSNTSLGYLATKYRSEFAQTSSDKELVRQNTVESSLQLRNVNHYRLSQSSGLEFGFDIAEMLNDWDYRVGAYTNLIGDAVPGDTLQLDESATVGGAFLSLTTRPLERLTTTVGLRFDRTGMSGNRHFSPRFSFSYELTERTVLTGAAGIYYQFLTPAVVAQDESFRDLRDPMAVHLILGMHRLLTPDTRLTLETYYKRYYHLPMDPDQPQLALIDEYSFGYYIGTFNRLSDIGKAYAAGIEATLQKKLVSGVYGLLSGSYSRSRYEGYDGIWRDRLVDNRVLFSVEGGFKPSNKWEYSLRWVYAGGRPYTPLDAGASAALNRSVRDRTRVNAERFPAYHSLNLRVDRHFNFSSSNLTVYFAVWNAYNRENVADHYWNRVERKEDVTYQWTILPIFGMEYEF